MSRSKIQIDLNRVEELAAQGLSQAEICVALGVSEDTLGRRKKDSADFAEALKQVDGDLQEKVDESGPYQWVIPDKYRFITLDCTADPSTFGAYPKDIQDNVARAVAEEKFDNPETAKKILESLTKSEVAKTAIASIKETKVGAEPPAQKVEDNMAHAGKTKDAEAAIVEMRNAVLVATMTAQYEKARELLTESRVSFARDIMALWVRRSYACAGINCEQRSSSVAPSSTMRGCTPV